MGKPHKLAKARIEIDSDLSIDRTIEIARHAVGTQRSLRIIGEGASGIRVALTGLLGGALMHFVVSAEDADGRTRVVSAIEQYRTSQTTVYFIPVGPKSMEGIGIYRRFMTTFGQAMQAADPSARIRMVEREDREPVVSTPSAVPTSSAPEEIHPPEVSAAVPAPDPVLPAFAPSTGAVSAVSLPAETVASDRPVPAAVAPPVPVPPTPQAPGPVTPAPLGQEGGGVSTASGISESTARTVQIVGGAIAVGGLIFWYATPSNVTVGPILVLVFGGVIAGIGFLLGRRANSAAADELAAKLRQERARNSAEAMKADTDAPVPPASSNPPGALVPVPPIPLTTTGVSAPAPLPPMPEPLTQLPIIPPVPAPVAATPVVVPSDERVPPVVPGWVPPPAERAGEVIASIPGLAPTDPASAASDSALGATAPSGPAVAVDQEDDLDVTRVVSPAAAWQVVLPDGRTLPIGSAMRFGRDPIADPTEPGTVLVPLRDPAKSISKTHAQLQLRDGELFVTDLHSTNGTAIVIDGSATRVLVEQPHAVRRDADLRLGEFVIQIRHAGQAGADSQAGLG
ncbi:FHA domain-containing protein [Microbacterium capsulatum]|uniref:FHA domain-containing protein n=1 Tax=Microbacterium capsulatum TaxID=3041921 RepID=A0ABU0XEA3_9MICO|nr:FHA domain-containing protein [Microbacterium sp. ASV81]MDQ4213449.1 FHA domain-containing protein [Microbacterium sp. ASV81]